MEKIVEAVWGPTATHAKGVMSSELSCHDPEANYQPYDPDLARQELSQSSYGTVSELPPLKIDLHRPDMVEMGRQLRAHWNDSLGVYLDILERESGQPRREESRFSRSSLESWIPDPTQYISTLLSRSYGYRDYYSGRSHHLGCVDIS